VKGKFFIVVFLMFFLATNNIVMAQKKEINAAEDQIKTGKDKEIEKAQQSLEKLLKDSTYRKNKKVWTLLLTCLVKKYQKGNETLYLKQKYDTANLFTIAKYMFEVAEAFDTVDAMPDKKGRVKIEYRKDNSEMLNRIRPNLYNGGLYYVRKLDYNKAYDFFNTYIDCVKSPLFREMDYGDNDKKLPTAAYWAVYCGYKLKDTKKTLHHTYWALKDTVHYEYMLQYLSETYRADKDTVRYIAMLDEGFGKYKANPYFYTRLVDYYAQVRDYDKALMYTDALLKSEPKNELARFTRSTILLNTGRYQECIDLCDSLIILNDTLYEAQLNAGLSYFNMAVALDKNMQKAKANRAKMQQYYGKARTYLEAYRKARPDEKNQWARPLYTIYLNLNMGKEFDEIDKMLRQ